MINVRHAKEFCSGDITEIENYEAAVNDKTETWDIHHRLELHPDNSIRFTRESLKRLGLYYNVEPSKLIFLKRKEHLQMHKKGKSITENQKLHRPKKLTEEHKRKIGIASKGRKMPFAGKTWKLIDGKRVWLSKEVE